MCSVNMCGIGYVFVALLTSLCCYNASSQLYLRIVGGAPTSIEQYPIVAQLLVDPWGEGDFMQHCAGVIVTAHHVISAAHCYQYSSSTGRNYSLPKFWRVRVGSTFRSHGNKLYKIKTIVIHRDFDAYHYINDIAVLVVTKSFAFGPGVRQGTISKYKNEIKTGSTCTIVGWGATESSALLSEHLRYTTVVTVEQETCRTRYRSISATISDSMICAGQLDVGGADGCFGDSGGPLLYKGVVVGLVSFGYACGHPYYPGVYTKISSFTDWILRTISKYK